MVARYIKSLIIITGVLTLISSYLFADENINPSSTVSSIVPGKSNLQSNDPLKKFFPSSYAGSIFSKKLGTVEVVKEKAEEVKEAKEEDKNQMEFVTEDVKKKTFLPPNETPQVAVNPEAPSSIISMIESNRRGDGGTAKAYARQFVRMLQNYFFEVRQITNLIGDALIEEKAISEDDWVGASQAIDIELAKTRMEKGIPIKPTHDVAMKRIIPDPKKEVEVYFLFTRSCSYCRLMAPDVERLYRAVKEDSRVKVTGLVVGEGDEVWLNEFRQYTGVTFPVFDGSELANNLNVKYLPVLFVVTPNGNKSYIKSGQQTFDRMYEFVKVAQGLAVEDSSLVQALIKTPMGEGEKLLLSSAKGVNATTTVNFSQKQPMTVSFPEKVDKAVQVDKF